MEGVYNFSKIKSLDKKRQILEKLISKSVRITMKRFTRGLSTTTCIELEPEKITGVIEHLRKGEFAIKTDPERKYPRGEMISHILKIKVLQGPNKK